EVSHAAGAPIHIVGEELHLAFNAVNFNQSAHPAHALRVFTLEGTGGREHDLLVGEDLRIADLAAFDDLETMARLGAGNPENSTKEQIKKVIEIHVGFVEKDDLPGLHASANLACPLGVVVTRGVDENKTGQETLEIETQMALRSSLAAAVFGPI